MSARLRPWLLSRRVFVKSFVLAAGASAVRAQDRDATFSTDVRVVNVLASVRDKQGRFVPDLAKEDFALTEDGRPQTIQYFSRETDLPLILGLLVDTSLSQRRVLGEEKAASYRFLDRVLRGDKDRTFVIHFDHETELLQDLTSSRTELRHALDLLELPADQRPRMQQGGGNRGGGYPGGGGIGFPGGMGRGGMGRRRGGYPGGGGGRAIHGAGTTLYDAVFLASDEIVRKQTGRKALILLTDGVDNGSRTFLNDAIESAQRADALVYSILFAGETGYQQFGGGRRGGGEVRDGKKVLRQISQETGGAFFEVSKKLTLDDVFNRIQEELRNQYSLGYTSDNASGAQGYRAIRVSVRQNGLTVQTREGYYPAAGTH